MDVKIGTTNHFHFRHHLSTPSQTLASAVSMFEQKRRRSSSSFSSPNGRVPCVDGADLVYGSSVFATPTTLSKSCLSMRPAIGRSKPIRRACFAVLGNFSDEEFMKHLQEFTFNFRLSDNGTSFRNTGSVSSKDTEETRNFPVSRMDSWMRTSEMTVHASGDIMSSLDMINEDKKKNEGGPSESAYCSVKKAFSSMVFMIRELQSYTLHMRQLLFYEDLRGILANVQREIHASFDWLFQQVFSCTPTLMLYVMILLANFTVYSMAHNTALAVSPPPPPATSATVPVSSEQKSPKIESRILFSKSTKNALSVGGGSGGGVGKSPLVAGGTDGGEGRLERELLFDSSLLSGNPTTSGKGIRTGEDEWSLWASIVEEATRMQAAFRGDELDRETVRALVAPVSAVIETDDPTTYFRTHLTYQNAIEQDPYNPLLLSNYGQFLHLVVHDYDRAEEYFERAARADPPDAEALNRYATFLWMIRKDISSAEERFLEAIAADPGNTYYAGNYAHFLWNTGGEDTCFPLDEA